MQNLFAICIHIRCSMNIEIKKIRMIVLSFLVKRFQAHCCQRRLLKHHSTYSATSFNCSIDSCWFKTKNIFFETKHEKTFHVLDSFLKLNRGVLFWWQTDKQTDRQTNRQTNGPSWFFFLVLDKTRPSAGISEKRLSFGERICCKQTNHVKNLYKFKKHMKYSTKAGH